MVLFPPMSDNEIDDYDTIDDERELTIEEKKAAAAAGGGSVGETVMDDGTIVVADGEGNEIYSIPPVGSEEAIEEDLDE